MPPPDNPLLRHEELDIDRKIVLDEEGAETASTALAPMLSMAGGGRRGRATERAATEIGTMAAMRLDAVEQSRAGSIGSATAGAVHGMAVAPTASAAPADAGGPDTMAPVPGVSNWVQVGPIAIPKGQTYGTGRVLVTGRVTGIVVHPTSPNTIYAATAQGGVWKTTDGGAHWTPKSDNEISMAIGAIAIDPGSPETIYAGTGEGNFSLDSYYGNGVLKSTNGGDTWTAHGTATFLTGRFSRIAVTPGTSARLFAATTFGVYRSTNSGANWSAMTSGIPASSATDLVIDPTTPTTVYAAIWGDGIYRTTNAGAATPSWTKLAGGLPLATSAPPAGFSRVALGISQSSPQTIYALFASNDTTNGSATQYAINKLYVTTDGGTTWNQITLPGGAAGLGKQGFYNINVAVDPTTPDIIFLSAISLWKGTRNTMTGVWTFTDIGGAFHPDNHAIAFHPTNHLIVYAGSDGGIYKTTNGGTTWDDSINKGLCIAQFEFIDQHPTSDAVVIGGTQDNGTEQFRNSPVFTHAADGDGGFTVIDQTQPRNVVHTYYGNSPERSTLGGRWGDYTAATHLNWTNVSAGILGSGLFYPPMALDQSNQNNIAFGTNRINLDASQGTGGWPTKVTLPGIGAQESVSAIAYVNSNLIYAGTSAGKVYRLSRSGGVWTAAAIQASPLPASFIWDISPLPGSPGTIVVVMSGFGISHVWQGVVPGSGAATWTNISGTGAVLTPTTPGRLPDIPVNALVIEPGMATTMYIGTDVGVFVTTNGGTTWGQLSQGLPNCAIFDLRLHAPSRLLRAATHGRGLWERQLDVASMPAVDLYVRDHSMHTGRVNPSPVNVPAAFEDPLHYVELGDILNWWMCADIKVDALEGATPAYQMSVAEVDYVNFEAKLQHRNAQRGKVNRVYVQVHNRGFQPASNVVVKLLFANASAGLPNLPGDFWSAFPNNSASTAVWTPIGTAKTIPSLAPNEPAVLEWDWSTPPGAVQHTCLLAVIDSASDPIPAGSRIFNVNLLVRNEKRVGLKNLHIVDPPPATGGWTMIDMNSLTTRGQTLRILPSSVRGWEFGLLLPKGMRSGTAKPEGVKLRKPTQTMLKQLEREIGEEVKKYDTTELLMVGDMTRGLSVPGLKIPKRGARLLLWIASPERSTGTATITIVQEDGKEIVGGNTFVLRIGQRKPG
jgi:photosystem II stability/assembly factor-like uncharacterized protein